MRNRLGQRQTVVEVWWDTETGQWRSPGQWRVHNKEFAEKYCPRFVAVPAWIKEESEKIGSEDSLLNFLDARFGAYAVYHTRYQDDSMLSEPYHEAFIVGHEIRCPECNYPSASLIREATRCGGILTLACDSCCWGGPHDLINDPLNSPTNKTINDNDEGEI